MTPLDVIIPAAALFLVVYAIPTTVRLVAETLRWMFPADVMDEEFLSETDPRRRP